MIDYLNHWNLLLTLVKNALVAKLFYVKNESGDKAIDKLKKRKENEGMTLLETGSLLAKNNFTKSTFSASINIAIK